MIDYQDRSQVVNLECRSPRARRYRLYFDAVVCALVVALWFAAAMLVDANDRRVELEQIIIKLEAKLAKPMRPPCEPYTGKNSLKGRTIMACIKTVSKL